MALMVLDADVERRLKAERAASHSDRYDEVWEGVYMMAPLANNEHQDLQSRLATVIRFSLGLNGPERVHAGANVSDREDDWAYNYRIPHVVVLPGGVARDCGTHWCGGPDFAVEIASPGDRSREKSGFYSAIGVRELMLIDRDPWSIELYRLASGKLQRVGRAEPADPTELRSEVIPLSFRLLDAKPRPKILVTHHDGKQTWTV